MSDDFLGHAIENGRVRFFSVSAVEKGDPQSNGCPRRYAFRYVFGFKEDESEKNKEAKQFGIAGHARLAEYLKTGIPALEACELRGKHLIPAPGPDLWIEQKFHRVDGATITSSLYAAGVPFTGFIDVGMRGRPVLGMPEFEPTDPPGTVEVNDWKFKGTDLDRNKNPTYKHRDELVHTIQMAGYGCVVGNTQPDVEHIRLSHTYFFKKPSANPRKVTKLHVIDDCRRTWEYVESVCRSLVHVAAETDIEKVPGNVRACDAYGGCPYREAKLDENGRVVRPACSTYQKNSLDVLFGKVSKDFNMPILSQVMQPQTAQQPQQSMQAQLAAEEAQQRQLQAQVQQQVAPQQAMTFVDAWNVIVKAGRGTPALGGNAAQAYAQACGQQLQPGAGYAGTGAFGRLQMLEPAHVLQLAGELIAEAQGQQPPAQQLPPMQAAPQMPTTQTFAGALPPDAPPSMPQLAQAHTQAPPTAPQQAPLNQPIPQQQDVPLTAPPAEAAAPAKKRGRPAKQPEATVPTSTQEMQHAAVPVAQTAMQPQASTTTPTPQSSVQQVAPASTSTSRAPSPTITAAVFVDCHPNLPYTDLHSWIADINAKLSKMYCVNAEGKPTVQDIRSAPKNQDAFAFGAWKGALYDVVVNNPPPHGILYIDTRTSELAAVVADAMQTVCDRAGVLYVRGVR